MAHASYFSWFDEVKTPEPAVWDLDGTSGPVPNAAYFAEVFRTVEELLLRRDPALAGPLSRLKVVVTPDAGDLPMTGPDVVALLVWDNWARVPRWNDEVGLSLAVNRDRSFRDAAKMLPRPLGLADVVDEARVRVERELWARGGRRPPKDRRAVVPVPLGYAHQREVPSVPWEERDIDVYFAGSTVHAAHRGGAVRRALRSAVGNIKVLHRERMMAAVEDLRRELPGLTVQVDIVDGDRVADKADTYSECMARARFCLDPRGTSRETYRYYEAARVGTVPIVTSLPEGGLYRDAPALRLKHWSDLPAAMRRMTQDPQEARELHEAMLAWYERRGSPQATAARLAPKFERVLRDLA